MKCSICSNNITEKYCSNCGQYFKNKKITTSTILSDLFGSIFSIEKSLFTNLKVAFLSPKKLIINYWKGFRRFYYSPSKFLTIASLFLFLHFLIVDDFLGISISSKQISAQLAFLLIHIFVFSFLSFIIYFKYKRNYNEHLIMNIYNVSFWSILFFPVSIILNKLKMNGNFELSFLLFYQLLIIIWNSKPFKINKLKRFGFIVINFLVLLGFYYLIFKYGTKK